MWNYRCSDDPTLEKCLFGAVKLVKNADINKYKDSGYVIEFDMKETFRFSVIGFPRNVIIFWVDISSSPHINYKKKIF